MTAKDEIRKTIGNNLKKYRMELNLTQEELAERAGISTAFLANVERGVKGLGLTTLRDVCMSLDISADNLLFEESCVGHIKNIAMLLQDKPEYIVLSAEKMVRLLLECHGGFDLNDRN